MSHHASFVSAQGVVGEPDRMSTSPSAYDDDRTSSADRGAIPDEPNNPFTRDEPGNARAPNVISTPDRPSTPTEPSILTRPTTPSPSQATVIGPQTPRRTDNWADFPLTAITFAGSPAPTPSPPQLKNLPYDRLHPRLHTTLQPPPWSSPSSRRSPTFTSRSSLLLEAERNGLTDAPAKQRSARARFAKHARTLFALLIVILFVALIALLVAILVRRGSAGTAAERASVTIPRASPRMSAALAAPIDPAAPGLVLSPPPAGALQRARDLFARHGKGVALGAMVGAAAYRFLKPGGGTLDPTRDEGERRSSQLLSDNWSLRSHDDDDDDEEMQSSQTLDYEETHSSQLLDDEEMGPSQVLDDDEAGASRLLDVEGTQPSERVEASFPDSGDEEPSLSNGVAVADESEVQTPLAQGDGPHETGSFWEANDIHGDNDAAGVPHSLFAEMQNPRPNLDDVESDTDTEKSEAPRFNRRGPAVRGRRGRPPFRRASRDSQSDRHALSVGFASTGGSDVGEELIRGLQRVNLADQSMASVSSASSIGADVSRDSSLRHTPARASIFRPAMVDIAVQTEDEQASAQQELEELRARFEAQTTENRGLYGRLDDAVSALAEAKKDLRDSRETAAGLDQAVRGLEEQLRSKAKAVAHADAESQREVRRVLTEHFNMLDRVINEFANVAGGETDDDRASAGLRSPTSPRETNSGASQQHSEQMARDLLDPKPNRQTVEYLAGYTEMLEHEANKVSWYVHDLRMRDRTPPITEAPSSSVSEADATLSPEIESVYSGVGTSEVAFAGTPYQRVKGAGRAKSKRTIMRK